MANKQAKSVTISKDGNTYTIRGLTADELTHLNNALTQHQDISGKLNTSLKGAANGLAELDENGKVPVSQLPSYVDDVIEGYYYNSKFYKDSTHTTEITGEAGKIYVDLSTEKTYRWSGSAFVVISETLALGTTSSTAFRGDYGNTAYGHAMDSDRLTVAKTEGLYKIAVSDEGHVKSATPITKGDITGLGIPGSDTTYEVASRGASGLCPALPTGTGTTKYLREDGSWEVPPDTQTDISGKADKVTGATNGNFASLDSNGNLVDSGHKHSDYLTEHQDISGKLDATLKGTANGLAELNASGIVPDAQLPSGTGTAISHAAAKGSAFQSGLYKITTNAEGHVTAASAVQKSDITGLGIPGQDTTYSAATTSTDGLMAATDKEKLDEIPNIFSVVNGKVCITYKKEVSA